MHPEASEPAEPRRPSGEWLAAHHDLLRPGLRVLDLGCGWGNDAGELRKLGLNVIGMDRSRENLEQARRAAPDVPLVQADMAQGLPFRSAAFDLVVASLSLHYFPWETTRRIARGVADVLRPEGRLLCRVNRVGDVNFDYGVGVEREPELFEVTPGHLKRFFCETTLAELLDEAFRVDVITPETTTRFGAPKQTLVARAKRRG